MPYGHRGDFRPEVGGDHCVVNAVGEAADNFGAQRFGVGRRQIPSQQLPYRLGIGFQPGHKVVEGSGKLAGDVVGEQSFSSTSRFIRFLLTASPIEAAMRAFSLGMSPGVNGNLKPNMYFARRGLNSMRIAISLVM